MSAELMIQIRIPSSLFGFLRTDTSWPQEQPRAWEAMKAAPRKRQGRGESLIVDLSLDEAWCLAEYLESRCRVRAAWDGWRYQQRSDGTWPGRDGVWCAQIAKQIESTVR